MRILTKKERARLHRAMAILGGDCEHPNDELTCEEACMEGADDLYWCEGCLSDIAARALGTIDALEARLNNSWALLENAHRGLDAIKTERDGLEAERNEWIHRAEAAEATQDSVSMMLSRALEREERDGDPVVFLMEVQRASTLCPPAEEARERTRKFADILDQILHPNGRCECEEGGWPCDWCAHPCEMCGVPRSIGCGCDSECLGCREYAEQVRDLEAERDALKTDLHLWQKTSSSLHAQVDWMAGMIGRIKSIATANHDTRTIGGAHAALREILAVIEGVDEEGGQ